MPTTFRERNGRTYVYRTESKRIPGKRNPVSVKEYIGVLDRDTGMVDVKPMPLETACSMVSDGRFTSLNRGGVLVAESAARR